MTLTQLFEQEREALLRQISADPGPDKVVKATRKCLDSVNFAYRECAGMEPFRQRLAATLIDLIKTAVSLQPDTYTAQVWYKNQTMAGTQVRKRKFPVWRLIEVVLLAALGAYMVYDHAIPFLYGLGALTLVEIVHTALAYGESRAPMDTSDSAPEVKAGLQIDGEALVRQLNQMLITADTILSEAAAAMDQVKQEHGLRPNHALLDFYQDLLEASHFSDGAFALKRIEALPQLLKEEGIGVVDYAEPSQKRFDRAPSLSSQQVMPRTLRPALVKGDLTLRRGLVEVPQYNDGEQAGPREVH